MLGVAATVALIVAGTSLALSAQAAGRSAVLTEQKSAAIAEVGGNLGVGSFDSDIAGSRLSSARGLASAELARSADVLVLGGGKAAAAELTAVAAAVDSTRFALVVSSSWESLLDTVYAQRSAQKAVTESVAVWEAQEQERIAAAAAAAAAQAAAAAHVAAQPSAQPSGRSFSSGDSSDDSSGSFAPSESASVSPAPAAGASDTYYAPGVTSTPPANESCGPCPGETLVLIDGYWGCPL